MPLTGVNGTIGEGVEQPNTPDIVQIETPLLNEVDYLPTTPQIYDVSHNKTPLSEGNDKTIINLLAGYAEGYNITVTWYHKIVSEADTVENESDVSFASDSVIDSYLKIHNMEVKLPAEMSFSYDSENAVSTLTGTLVTYPGFNPRPGDLFIYRIDNGQYGLFRIINTPERLSIRSGTMHNCEFTLDRILDTDTYQDIEDRVRQQAYFNKKRFLMESAALLTHEEMLDYELLLQQCNMLELEYVKHFYDRTLKSFVRDDGVYDPYVVAFIQLICGSYVAENYVMQLLPDIDGLNSMDLLWNKLITRDNIGSIINTATIFLNTVDSKEIRPTGLINRKYLRYSEDGEDKITCFNITEYNASTYNLYEHIIVVYLLYGVVEHHSIQELINTVRTATVEEKFYYIPLLLFFIKKLLISLTRGTPLKYTTTSIEPYIKFAFTDSDLDENNVLSIELNGGVPVAIITEDGEVLHIDDVDIVNSGLNAYTIDLDPVLTSSVYTVTTWYVLATNGLIE